MLEITSQFEGTFIFRHLTTSGDNIYAVAEHYAPISTQEFNSEEVYVLALEGGVWQAVNVSNTPEFLSRDARAVMDEAGTLHVIWREYEPNASVSNTFTVERLLYATYKSGMVTSAELISEVNANRRINERPSELVIGHEGRLHIAYTEVEAGAIADSLVVLTNEGAGWKRNVVPRGDRAGQVTLAHLPSERFLNGELHAVFLQGQGPGRSYTLINTFSPKNGENWTFPLAANPPDYPDAERNHPKIVAKNDNQLMMVWLENSDADIFMDDIWYVNQADERLLGAYTPQRLDTNPLGDVYESVLATEPNGTIHIVYYAATFFGGAHEMRYSQWNGSSWSTPEVLTRALTTDAALDASDNCLRIMWDETHTPQGVQYPNGNVQYREMGTGCQ